MNKEIKGTLTLRPRYGEVDRMGYVYHANYVSYCHQARTELLRQLGICDEKLESKNIMLPVIDMNMKFHKPAKYDEVLTIETLIKNMPVTRFQFQFETRNNRGELLFTANSTVVFVDSKTRKPMKAPKLVIDALINHFEPIDR